MPNKEVSLANTCYNGYFSPEGVGGIFVRKDLPGCCHLSKYEVFAVVLILSTFATSLTRAPTPYYCTKGSGTLTTVALLWRPSKAKGALGLCVRPRFSTLDTRVYVYTI